MKLWQFVLRVGRWAWRHRVRLILFALGLILFFHTAIRWWPFPSPDWIEDVGIGLIILGCVIPNTFTLALAQRLIVAGGLLLAGLHAFEKGHWPPAIDALTYTGVGIAIVGLILPRVTGFRFGEISVDLTGVIKNADYAFKQSIDVTETWVLSLSSLNRQYQSLNSREEARTALIRFCTDALREALRLIAESGEVVRLSIWLYNSNAARLEFLVSNDEARNKEGATRTFKRGEGLIGQAFVDNAEYWTEEASAEPYYVQPTGGRSSYNGLLLVPICFGNNEIFGMLSVDRTKREDFKEDARSSVRSLAHIVSIALTHPGLRKWLTLLPDFPSAPEAS